MIFAYWLGAGLGVKWAKGSLMSATKAQWPQKSGSDKESSNSGSDKVSSGQKVR